MTPVQIARFDIFRLRLPMKFTFKTSFGDIPFRETVVIKLTTDDGVVGYGESAALTEPVYLEESTDTVIAILENVLKPIVLNKALTPSDFYQETQHLRGNKIAKFGVECALWSIISQISGKPIVDLLGGTRREINLGESIGILPTVDETLQLITKRVEEGYHRIKVKIKPGWDVELVKIIRQSFPDLVLMVDANSAYTLDDLDTFKQLDNFNLLMIEQPLEFDDLWHHSLLQKEIKTPICLDESIVSYSKAKKAIELKACGIINVKPGRIGSLVEVLQINQLAKEQNIPLWCGGMLEAGIANAFNIFTASLSEFSLPADIFPSAKIFTEDIIVPEITMTKNGTVKVSRQLGLGFAVNEELIQNLLI